MYSGTDCVRCENYVNSVVWTWDLAIGFSAVKSWRRTQARYEAVIPNMKPPLLFMLLRTWWCTFSCLKLSRNCIFIHVERCVTQTTLFYPPCTTEPATSTVINGSSDSSLGLSVQCLSSLNNPINFAVTSSLLNCASWS